MDKIIGWLVIIIIIAMLVTGGVYSTKPNTEYNADTAAMYLTFGSLFAGFFLVTILYDIKKDKKEESEESKDNPFGCMKLTFTFLIAMVIYAMVLGIAYLFK